MKLKTGNKRLKSRSTRRLPKYIVIMSNDNAIIGHEWWVMKQAIKSGKRIIDMYEIKIRENKVIIPMSILLERIENEKEEISSRSENNLLSLF